MAEDALAKEEFAKRLKDAFHGAVRAVSEVDDFDFYAIPQVVEASADGSSVLSIFPSPTKEFRLDITSIEEVGDEWHVFTPKQRWAFRRLPAADLPAFKTEMKKAGLNVD